jgi:hypothetical protein
MPSDKAKPSSGRKFYRTFRNSRVFECNIFGKNNLTNGAREFGSALRGSVPGRNPIQRLVEAAKYSDPSFAV